MGHGTWDMGHETGKNFVQQMFRERNLTGSGDEVRWIESVPDFVAAKERVLYAIERKEMIGIFGDYDCDGLTSVAILLRMFEHHSPSPFVRLPHRLSEGYGLTSSIIEECVARQVTLLITADTGVTAVHPIARAKEAGIDVIVCDHHALPAVLPSEAMLLHPALAKEAPDPMPSAAGVVMAFAMSVRPELLHDPLCPALAATGTIADMVELRGINRVIATHGLHAMKHLPPCGLKTLLESVGTLHPSASDIAFRIAPRLNAAGRMEDPMIALKALCGDMEALTRLHVLNTVRQEATERLFQSALNDPELHEYDSFLYSVSEEYSPGLVGLIAGRLTEKFGKPSFVGSIENDMCRGSFRSIPHFDLQEGLRACEGIMQSFGGHRQAGGCTLHTRNLADMRMRLAKAVAARVTKDMLRPTMEFDATLSPSMITMDFCRELATLEPFGQGNPEPRFLIEGAQLRAHRTVGRDGSHLQALLGELSVVGFGFAKQQDQLLGPVDLLCRPNINEWNGKQSVQLVMDDARITQAQASLPSQTPQSREPRAPKQF